MLRCWTPLHRCSLWRTLRWHLYVSFLPIIASNADSRVSLYQLLSGLQLRRKKTAHRQEPVQTVEVPSLVDLRKRQKSDGVVAMNPSSPDHQPQLSVNGVAKVRSDSVIVLTSRAHVAGILSTAVCSAACQTSGAHRVIGTGKRDAGGQFV